MWSRLVQFFTEMDSQSQRSLWITVALFAAVAAILGFGVTFIDINQGLIANFLRSLRDAWWAPAAVTGVFVVLAFIGAPQFVLIAATVVVFGPVLGFELSWVATMISASVGFLLGRHLGAESLERFGGGTVKRVSRLIGKNGFLASLIVRLVPSAPFIVVNMAAGVSAMRFSHFLAGTALGIIPKAALVSFAGHGLNEVLANENLPALIFFAAALAIWLVIVLIVRPLIRSQAVANDLPDEGPRQ
jgi:uncharacterized membrane protein YdjX (TVP38/TMEM64 family)